MITETPIAFGLTMVVCLSLFFYCWYIRKLRYRLTTVQVSVTPDEFVEEEQPGMEGAVVATFPTVKTHELKDDGLQCPICLIEYVNTELLRKLPLCGHVFHIHCVDSWLQKHVTCPVCRIVLTEYHPKPEPIRQTPETAYCRGSSSPSSVTIEIVPATPAWVLVNRPQQLPPSNPPKTSSCQTLGTRDSSESGDYDTDLELSESTIAMPLRDSRNAAGWGIVYSQRSTITSSHQTLDTRDSMESGDFGTEQELSESAIAPPRRDPQNATVYSQRSACNATFSFRSRAADIAIIERCVSERWITESFSVAVASTEERGSFDENRGSAAASFGSDGRKRPWRTESWDFGQIEEDESARGLPPLTVAPEHCSFEFFPVVTGPGGDYSLTDFHR